MSLTPSQIRQITEEYLSILYPYVGQIEITFLVKDETAGRWKVNIRFNKSAQDLFPYLGLLSINDKGEIIEFKEGWSWRY